jgi:hypothetical protein
MRLLPLAALAAALAAGGCSLQYDRYGNPIGAGFTLAASDEPTTMENIADGVGNAAWLINPQLGIAAAGVLGAFGYGKREQAQRAKAADAAWDNAQRDLLLRQAQPVSAAEVAS